MAYNQLGESVSIVNLCILSQICQYHLRFVCSIIDLCVPSQICVYHHRFVCTIIDLFIPTIRDLCVLSKNWCVPSQICLYLPLQICLYHHIFVCTIIYFSMSQMSVCISWQIIMCINKNQRNYPNTVRSFVSLNRSIFLKPSFI